MNDYHIHTKYCKHAIGTATDYVNAAQLANVEEIGISDHTPLPEKWFSDIRMSLDEFEKYDSEIDFLKSQNLNIKVFKGLECDWVDKFKNFYVEELLEKRSYDYLIGSVHWFKYDNTWKYAYDMENNSKYLLEYAKRVIEAMEAGIFDFIAHPDLFGGSFTENDWDENMTQCSIDIIQAATELNAVLEINGNGFRRLNKKNKPAYPMNKFWEIASDYSVRVICNSDAHRPNEVTSNISKCLKVAEKFKLKRIKNFKELTGENKND